MTEARYPPPVLNLLDQVGRENRPVEAPVCPNRLSMSVTKGSKSRKRSDRPFRHPVQTSVSLLGAGRRGLDVAQTDCGRLPIPPTMARTRHKLRYSVLVTSRQNGMPLSARLGTSRRSCRCAYSAGPRRPSSRNSDAIELRHRARIREDHGESPACRSWVNSPAATADGPSRGDIRHFRGGAADPHTGDQPGTAHGGRRACPQAGRARLSDCLS